MNKLQEAGVILITSVLVIGSLFIALKSPKVEAVFLDLAKIGVGGYLGYSINRKE